MSTLIRDSDSASAWHFMRSLSGLPATTQLSELATRISELSERAERAIGEQLHGIYADTDYVKACARVASEFADWRSDRRTELGSLLVEYDKLLATVEAEERKRHHELLRDRIRRSMSTELVFLERRLAHYRATSPSDTEGIGEIEEAIVNVQETLKKL